MWTVVFVTSKPELAAKLKSDLLKMGILSRIKISEHTDDCETDCLQILVPYGEVDEALNFIIDADI